MAEGPGTVCPLCAVGCRLAPANDGERAVGREGPSNPNGRLCRKGVFAPDSVPDEDRITRPLVRRDGDLEPAAWDAAYDRVVGGIERALDRGGPDALGFLGAPHSATEENYLLGKLARTLGTNNVDNRARLCHVSTARALADRLGWPATTAGLADLRRADVILVVGADPAQRQPIAFDSYVRPAVHDGATLIHVDPAGSETTDLADVHLAPRPDTDALLLELLCGAVTDAGGVDRAFVDARTRNYGAFADALSGIDRPAAAETASVDPGAVQRVARAITEADGVAAVVGTGIEGGDREPTAADALINLLLLTGNLGRPGAGLFLFRGLANEQGATDAGCVPDRLPGDRPVTDPDARARVAEVWGREPPARPGRTARELLADFGEGVRAALVVGENPAVSKRDPEWVRTRLSGLDTLAVVELTHSATTEHADVVLPAAAPLEKRGTVTSLDRRIQPLAPVLAAPAGVRTDFEILRSLGSTLRPDAFDAETPGQAFAELAALSPAYEGIDYPEPGAVGARWPAEAGRVLYREQFHTPDGRAPFVAPGGTDDSARRGGLTPVVSGRATDAGPTAPDDDRIRLHPDDAAARGIDDGTDVRLAAGGATVEGVAALDDSVRRGTVALHASLADPIERCSAGSVEVRPVGRQER